MIRFVRMYPVLDQGELILDQIHENTVGLQRVAAQAEQLAGMRAADERAADAISSFIAETLLQNGDLGLLENEINNLNMDEVRTLARSRAAETIKRNLERLEYGSDIPPMGRGAEIKVIRSGAKIYNAPLFLPSDDQNPDHFRPLEEGEVITGAVKKLTTSGKWGGQISVRHAVLISHVHGLIKPNGEPTVNLLMLEPLSNLAALSGGSGSR